MPVRRAAIALPPNLPERRERDDRQRTSASADAVVEQADLRAQAAVGEEQRQQEHDGEVLELLAQAAREAVIGPGRIAPTRNAPNSAWMPISSVAQRRAKSSDHHGDAFLAESARRPCAARQQRGAAAGRTTTIITPT